MKYIIDQREILELKTAKNESYNQGVLDVINIFKHEINDELVGNTFIIDFLDKAEKLKK